MYYQIQESVLPISLQDIDYEKLTLAVITLKELEDCYETFGFSPLTVTECKNDTQHTRGMMDVYEDYYFGIIYGINPKHIIKIYDRIAIYMKHNLFILVIIEDTDDSIRTNFLESLNHWHLSNLTLERLVCGFLESIIKNDYKTLEEIEASLSEHEDRINESKLNKNFNNEITRIRKKLLVLDNYYEQLIIIGEELMENGIDLFGTENLRYFKIFTDRATRLSNNTRALQEYSIHVRESYHAQLDYNLNSIMKMFTVVTTIFLPLSIIVGWYGMNFTTMPELTWKYGYLFVIVISSVVAIGCLLYFKKKKFL